MRKAFTKPKVGARLICPEKNPLSLRAQAAPTERSSARINDSLSHERRAVAVVTPACANSVVISPLGVDAINSTLPSIKAASSGRDTSEVTPSGRAGGERGAVALAAADTAERARARRALSASPGRLPRSVLRQLDVLLMALSAYLTPEYGRMCDFVRSLGPRHLRS